MKLKEKILKLYYIDKEKQKDIAKKLKVSKYIVSRTVAKDPRYEEEKLRRKIENKKKNIEYTKKYIDEKRKSNDDYLCMKRQHEQAVLELSGGRKPINNRVYKKWNSSAYRFDSKSKSYVLKKGLTTGADVPKKISWK